MRPAQSEAMPAELILREIRLQVRERSERIRTVILVTTLLDADLYPPGDPGLFRQRWHAELDLRSLKTVMSMDVLRGKSPEMVRKEIAVHLLAYDLIRRIMAEAARVGEVKPRQLSFKEAPPTIQSFEECTCTIHANHHHLHPPPGIKASESQRQL